MDNFATHKVKGVLQAIEARKDHPLYLPPLLAKPQSDRNVLLKTQGIAPKSR